MTATADAPFSTVSIPAVSRPACPLDVRIATDTAGDAAVTVRGHVDPGGATTVVELVRALVATGAVHVIVDVDGADAPGDLGVTRLLAPLRAALRSRGGWLMVAGDGGVPSTSARDVDLQDAFSAYRDVIASGPLVHGAAR
jgi:hypothetical protein